MPAHLGSPGQRAAKRLCVCVYFFVECIIITPKFSVGSLLFQFTSSECFKMIAEPGDNLSLNIITVWSQGTMNLG